MDITPDSPMCSYDDMQALMTVLDDNHANLDVITPDVITGLSTDAIRHSDLVTKETIFHKCAKLPYSDKLQRIVQHCLTVDNQNTVSEPDISGVEAILVAIVNNRIWFVDCLWSANKKNGFYEQWRNSTSCSCNGIEFVEGSTLLHAAVLAAKPDVITYFLGKQIPIPVQDSDGKTAIQLANENKAEKPQLLKCFIAKPDIVVRMMAEINTQSSNQSECFEILLENGASVNMTSAEFSGYMPLYVAAEKGKHNLVKMFIRYGANVNRRNAHTSYTRRYDLNHATALHVALKAPHIDVVHALLAAGADVNIADHMHRTPLHVVCDVISSPSVTDQPDVYKQLRDCIWLLIHAGCAIHNNDSFGRTPVNMLVHNLSRCMEAIAILLASGDEIVLQGADARQVITEERILADGIETARFVLNSGYTFKHVNAMRRKFRHTLAGPMMTLLRTPLSLKRYAANVIRRQLQPNAVVGVEKLSLPSGFQKNYITLNLSSVGS